MQDKDTKSAGSAGGAGAAKGLGYEASGVNINEADAVKKRFLGVVSSCEAPHVKPINRVGAFASLVDIDLSRWNDPVFVLKTEEPGSKQLLSVERGKLDWLARDLINHLINDIAVTGATPCAVLDTIICGKLEPETVYGLVSGMSEACRENNCILVGGETSEQPGVLPEGRYVLQAGALGVVERDARLDGSRVEKGDAVLAFASNGLHTNGYSLVRRLMDEKPEIKDEKPGGEDFMDALLKPHTGYYRAIAASLDAALGCVRAMAHITGGGIRDNLARVMPQDGSLTALIELDSLRVPPIFGVVKRYAGVDDAEMLRTFNCGAGLVVVADAERARAIADAAKTVGIDAYQIGTIIGTEPESGASRGAGAAGAGKAAGVRSGAGSGAAGADSAGAAGGGGAVARYQTVAFTGALRW